MSFVNTTHLFSHGRRARVFAPKARLTSAITGSHSANAPTRTSILHTLASIPISGSGSVSLSGVKSHFCHAGVRTGMCLGTSAPLNALNGAIAWIRFSGRVMYCSSVTCRGLMCDVWSVLWCSDVMHTPLEETHARLQALARSWTTSQQTGRHCWDLQIWVWQYKSTTISELTNKNNIVCIYICLYEHFSKMYCKLKCRRL